MNPVRKIMHQCTECGELHEREYAAVYCCPPEAEEITCWECAECDEVHMSEEVARLCCYEGDEPLPATPAELEAAGQQRLAL